MSEVTMRRATRDDLPAIDRLFRQSFTDTFGHLYAREDLDAFLAGFTPEAWQEEFDDPGHAFLVAEADGTLIGYTKLGPPSIPVESTRPLIELRQIYFDHAWLGRGLSRPMMDWAIEEGRRRGAEEMYLTVFTDNHRARALYRRYGFVEVGPYAFMVGNHADEDIIMRLDL
jgi:ribosomal protein S18 acetylase RimI-like enzyme